MGRDIEIINRGSIGIITDGDEVTRPKGSCAVLTNFDYDTENNLIKTRNNTTSANLLDGFTMPTGYEIMVGGLQTFSFNAPIDRQVVLLFVKHTVNGDVRIYVNTWYNPPAPNTDPVGSSNDYENYHSAETPDAWFDEWIELTEEGDVVDFAITGNLTATADGSALDMETNHYRGWFLYNEDVGDVNKRFVCIEDFSNDGATGTFTIQNRRELSTPSQHNFATLGWNTGDTVRLIRYPIKKLTTFNFTEVEVIKTNTSVKILCGQDGNLWFGFVNKDINKVTASNLNQNFKKWYGWWLDFEQYPVDVKLSTLPNTATFDIETDNYTAMLFKCTQTGTTDSINMLAFTALVDGTQSVCIYKGLNTAITNQALRIVPIPYHHYSRRITGVNIYRSVATKEIDDPIRDIHTWSRPYYDTFFNQYPNYPIYAFPVNGLNINTASAWSTGSSLETEIGYLPKESIYTADKYGVFAGDILFTFGDSDKPDRLSFSAIQDGVVSEDIFPLQNRKTIGSSDKDKLTALTTLGNKIVAIKNNSLHTILPLDTGEGFRLLGSVPKIGTAYGRTVIETAIGILFANEDGIFLYNLDKPINILEGYRLQEYYTLNKSLMFAEWHSTRKEAWFYVGNGKVWILNISNKGQIGWNDYQFPNSWDIIDFITDEDKNFYVVKTDGVYRFKKDNEVTDAFDVGSVGIPYDFKQNFEVVDNTRGRRWKVIETKIFCKLEARDGLVPDGNIETVNVEFYRNGETSPFLTKAIKINASNTLPKTIVVRNNVSNSQRNFAIRVHGTLNFLKRLSISEVYARAIPLTQQIKEGIYEQPFIQ